MDVHVTGAYLMGVHLMGVYLMGVYLMGVYLMGVHLIGVYLMGVRLIDVYFYRRVYVSNSKKALGKPPALHLTNGGRCRDLSCQNTSFCLRISVFLPPSLNPLGSRSHPILRAACM